MVFLAISLTGEPDSSAAVHPCDHLLQMVTSMDLVKTSPPMRRQRAEHGMVEQPGAGPEPLLGIGERGIHCDQRVVKATQRIIAQCPAWLRMSRRFDTRWEPANSQDVEAPQMLPKVWLSALGLTGFHGSKQPLRSRRIGQHEVLEYLEGVPLSIRCA